MNAKSSEFNVISFNFVNMIYMQGFDRLYGFLQRHKQRNCQILVKMKCGQYLLGLANIYQISKSKAIIFFSFTSQTLKSLTKIHIA